MNKNIRWNSNTVWDIGIVSQNKAGESLCGDQCLVEHTGNSTTVILSDGLGSGVKANILSTLTSTMLTTMLQGNVPLDECVTTVAETLPMCRERKLAYATFTILMTEGDTVRLVQYDNPNAIFLQNGAVRRYNYSAHFIQEKELHESRLSFDAGDMLILFSDGVSEAGRGVTTDAGWEMSAIEDFVTRNYSPEISAQRMAAKIMSCVRSLDLDTMADDATVAVIKLRSRCPVNVMIGPPENKDDDLSTMRLFFAKEGKHVVCGGTTAKIAAEYLGVPVQTNPTSPDPDIPPISVIEGVDLTTEGIITVDKILSYAIDYVKDNRSFEQWCYKKDGASLAARLLFEDATDINMFIGHAANPAHNEMPINFNVKMQILKKLSKRLKEMGKRVKVLDF